MISRNGKGGGLAAHYDWIALAVGVLVLIGGAVFYVTSIGGNSDEAAAAAVGRLNRMKPAEIGVPSVDMTALQAVSAGVRKPAQLSEVAEKAESFLASERRVLCVCGKAISGDVKAVPVCPYCGVAQKEEKKAVLDADGDGIADEWEKKYGLNASDPADAALDPDGDEFTNLEEYLAKTDPTDPKDHPDYLDSVKIVLPLKETSMPFAFRKAYQIPAGWRCEFVDPSRKDDNGRMGKALTAIVGSEIEDKDPDAKKSGFILKSYTPKSEKRAIPGSELQKTVDVSEAVVERKRDGKVITLVIQEGKSVKLAPMDVQATLTYSRKTVENIDVVPGSEIVLSGTKYQITDIKAVGKGAKISVKQLPSGHTRVLEALEP